MNTPHGFQRLRAHYAFPVAGPAIENALVTIAGGRVAEVTAIGPHTETTGSVDLGDVAIVPGLVNAHTHLEFSHLARPLGRPAQTFPEWIREVVAWRRSGAEPPAERPAIMGLRESAAAGTTTLGEIVTAGWSRDDFDASRLNATVFYELIGLKRERIEPNLELAREHVALGHRRESPTSWLPGISPHAPYTVHPDLFAQLVALAAVEQVPLALHLAESREELELLATGTGPFLRLLEELDAWQSEAIPRGTRPLDYLRRLAGAHRALVIHGNYLADDEVAILAEHADRLALVYCPRTHHYFGHERYRLGPLIAAGVTMALGTDSRASNPDLSLWNEMRFVAANHADVPPAKILELGTLGGARALGLDADRGTITTGQRADLTIVSLPAKSTNDPYELLFAEVSKPIATICGGQITADRENRFTTSSEAAP